MIFSDDKKIISVARRLFIYIFFAGVFMTIFTTSLILYFQYRKEIDNINNTFSQIRIVHLPSIVSTLWSSDYELLKLELDGIVNLPYIDYVSVKLPDGKIISSDTLRPEKFISREIPMEASFMNKEVPLGTLIVVTSMNDVYKELTATALIGLAVSVGIILAMSVIFFFAFQTLIGKPLSAFALYVSSVNTNSLDTAFDFNGSFKNDSKDELYQLISAFNSMTVSLKDSFLKLEKTNENLIKEIKEKEKAEEALIESEKRFRALFEQASVGVAQIETKTGTFLKVNKRYGDILGYNPEEMIGITFQQLTHPDDLEADLSNMNLLIKGEIKEFTMEKRYYHKSGAVVWTLMTVSPLWDKEEKALYHIAVIQDITERKIMEQDKVKLENQLRQSQKMEVVGTLAGGIAHDFNNILGAIIGFAELSILDLPPDSPVNENLERILASSDRAKELTKQILSFSRKEQQEVKPLQISLLIKDNLKLLRPLLPSSIEIKENIQAKSSVIMGDTTQIHQILMNLCTNASYAMREKVGTISIHLTEIDMSPSYFSELKEGTYVRLTVSDTGPGMEKNIMERIFEPYFTTKKQGEGTGMGLSVVYGIVKSYGGHISVYSEPGEGTTFHVYLPVVDSKATSEISEIVKGGNERILFVDDEEELVHIYRSMLKSLGYDVLATSNSEEALEIFSKEADKFDLLITDYAMPKLTGIDLSSEILKIRQDFPIILCSGFSETINKENAIRFGIREFLVKPLDKKIIAGSIRRIFDENKKS